VGQGTVCERVDQPVDPLLDLTELALGPWALLDLRTLWSVCRPTWRRSGSTGRAMRACEVCARWQRPGRSWSSSNSLRRSRADGAPGGRGHAQALVMRCRWISASALLLLAKKGMAGSS